MDKQKEKEEMARIIAFELCSEGKRHKFLYGNKSECYSNNNFADCKQIKSVVDKLYNADYGKIDKDSVVLAMEEYESLLKIKEQSSIRELNYFSNLRKLQRELEQVEKERDSARDNCDRKSKETAEKLIKFVSKHCDNETLIWQLDEFVAKSLGVEIKEK